MSQTVPVVVSPTAPGADANTYVLFATVAVTGTGYSFPNPGWGKYYLGMHGLKRLVLDLKHNAALTLNPYKSSDRGVTWHQLDTEAVAVPAATESTTRTYLVEEYADFKLEAVNGGSAQTTWNVSVALSPERAT